MTFTPEQLRIIEAARPLWEGFQKSQTLNTGQREIADLREVYEQTFGLSGANPEWSGGCAACVTNCMARIYAAVPEKPINEKASIATDEQPKPKAKKKPSKK